MARNSPHRARQSHPRNCRAAALHPPPLRPLKGFWPCPRCYYSKDHEWVRLGEDGLATVGITDHAQEALGDIVFVELPEPGRAVAEGEACAVVESVKAASDIYAPLAGTVTEINEAIVDDPALVNSDAEGDGWFFRLRLADPGGVDELMDRGRLRRISGDAVMQRAGRTGGAGGGGRFRRAAISGPTTAEIAAMLQAVGAASLDDLIAQTVPERSAATQALDLPPAIDEAGGARRTARRWRRGTW